MNISQREDSFLKIGLGTAENEPSKVCHKDLTPYTYNVWISQPSLHLPAARAVNRKIKYFLSGYRQCTSMKSGDDAIRLSLVGYIHYNGDFRMKSGRCQRMKARSPQRESIQPRTERPRFRGSDFMILFQSLTALYYRSGSACSATRGTLLSLFSLKRIRCFTGGSP